MTLSVRDSDGESCPLLPKLAQTERVNSDRCDQTDIEGTGINLQVLPKPRPLPKVQLGILCLLRMLDPMCYNQIFPYINEFVSEMNIAKDESQVGFYSGLVESAYALTQLLAIYPWSYTSDHLGRRPVVLAGTVGLSVTTLLFGLSRNYSTVLITRALGGLASGNIPVIPSMLIELTDDTNQAVVFAFFGMWWPVGSTLGPFFGGMLSKPATRYPGYVNFQFLSDNPYFLPCFVVAAWGLFGFAAGFFVLEETLESRKPKKTASENHSDVSSKADQAGARYTARQLLGFPIIRALCLSGCALSFISTSFDVLFVLFCYSPVHLGGLAFSPAEIGFALSTSGFLAAIMQVFFMPTVLRRVDHPKLYHFSMRLWPYVFMGLPLLNVIARQGLDPETGKINPGTVQLLWMCIAILLGVFRVAVIGYTVNMLIVKKYAPSQASLGSTTGLIQFSICAARAVAPAFASTLFAFSASTGSMGGYLWVPVLTALAFTGTRFTDSIIKETSRT